MFNLNYDSLFSVYFSFLLVPMFGKLSVRNRIFAGCLVDAFFVALCSCDVSYLPVDSI